MVAMALFADNRVHSTFTDNLIFRLIPGIKVQVLSFVTFLYKRLDNIGVMDTCVRGCICFNELGLLVSLDMCLVAEVRFTAFLRVSRICILMAFLVWIVVPQALAIA